MTSMASETKANLCSDEYWSTGSSGRFDSRASLSTSFGESDKMKPKPLLVCKCAPTRNPLRRNSYVISSSLALSLSHSTMITGCIWPGNTSSDADASIPSLALLVLAVAEFLDSAAAEGLTAADFAGIAFTGTGFTGANFATAGELRTVAVLTLVVGAVPRGEDTVEGVEGVLAVAAFRWYSLMCPWIEFAMTEIELGFSPCRCTNSVANVEGSSPS
mmetsp:Transcript_14317/g.23811  ORF Transcript_14317/g.23811 Transcript_14317/m.23811 type:complete len:217 (+) Transcript_14317:158-808(+)